MLGRVKAKHRDPNNQRIASNGLDPEAMRPILTVRDVRRRIYLLKNGKPFMSVSHDQATAGLWWGWARFCEIEPELNEIGFTEADPQTRAYMETVLHRVVSDLLAAFPEIERNLTPKYNKAFDQLEADVPFLRAMVRHGFHDDGMVVLVLGGAALVGGLTVFSRLSRRRPRRAPAVSHGSRGLPQSVG
jgi:hypothetical protein